MFPRRIQISIFALLAAMTLALAGCAVNAGTSADFLTPTPQISKEQVNSGDLEQRWGEMVRWRIENATWSIELPEQGNWDSGGPFNESGFSANNVTYRTVDRARNDLSESLSQSLFVEIQRFALDSLFGPPCIAPTVFTPDGGLISTPLNDIFIDGYEAKVTRISEPNPNGSATGTLQVCFTTSAAMYQISAAASPYSVIEDLFGMLRTFKIES